MDDADAVKRELGLVNAWMSKYYMPQAEVAVEAPTVKALEVGDDIKLEDIKSDSSFNMLLNSLKDEKKVVERIVKQKIRQKNNTDMDDDGALDREQGLVDAWMEKYYTNPSAAIDVPLTESPESSDVARASPQDQAFDLDSIRMEDIISTIAYQRFDIGDTPYSHYGMVKTILEDKFTKKNNLRSNYEDNKLCYEFVEQWMSKHYKAPHAEVAPLVNLEHRDLFLRKTLELYENWDPTWGDKTKDIFNKIFEESIREIGLNRDEVSLEEYRGLIDGEVVALAGIKRMNASFEKLEQLRRENPDSTVKSLFIKLAAADPIYPMALRYLQQAVEHENVHAIQYICEHRALFQETPFGHALPVILDVVKDKYYSIANDEPEAYYALRKEENENKLLDEAIRQLKDISQYSIRDPEAIPKKWDCLALVQARAKEGNEDAQLAILRFQLELYKDGNNSGYGTVVERANLRGELEIWSEDTNIYALAKQLSDLEANANSHEVRRMAASLKEDLSYRLKSVLSYQSFNEMCRDDTLLKVCSDLGILSKHEQTLLDFMNSTKPYLDVSKDSWSGSFVIKFKKNVDIPQSFFDEMREYSDKDSLDNQFKKLYKEVASFEGVYKIRKILKDNNVLRKAMIVGHDDNLMLLRTDYSITELEELIVELEKLKTSQDVAIVQFVEQAFTLIGKELPYSKRDARTSEERELCLELSARCGFGLALDMHHEFEEAFKHDFTIVPPWLKEQLVQCENLEQQAKYDATCIYREMTKESKERILDELGKVFHHQDMDQSVNAELEQLMQDMNGLMDKYYAVLEHEELSPRDLEEIDRYVEAIAAKQKDIDKCMKSITESFIKKLQTSGFSSDTDFEKNSYYIAQMLREPEQFEGIENEEAKIVLRNVYAAMTQSSYIIGSSQQHTNARDRARSEFMDSIDTFKQSIDKAMKDLCPIDHDSTVVRPDGQPPRRMPSEGSRAGKQLKALQKAHAQLTSIEDEQIPLIKEQNDGIITLQAAQQIAKLSEDVANNLGKKLKGNNFVMRAINRFTDSLSSIARNIGNRLGIEAPAPSVKIRSDQIEALKNAHGGEKLSADTKQAHQAARDPKELAKRKSSKRSLVSGFMKKRKGEDVAFIVPENAVQKTPSWQLSLNEQELAREYINRHLSEDTTLLNIHLTDAQVAMFKEPVSIEFNDISSDPVTVSFHDLSGDKESVRLEIPVSTLKELAEKQTQEAEKRQLPRQ